MSNDQPDDFYFSYDDYPSVRRIANPANLSFNTPLGETLARIFLVVLLRAGFVLIHVGSVPVNNVNLILLQNIVDFCWVTIVYFLIGTVIAYTGDRHGVIGGGHWVGDSAVDKDEIMIGWSAVVIAAAICTSAIVGRTHTVGYLVIGLLLTGLVQPFLIHWIWTPEGWVRTNMLGHKNVKFNDSGGCVIVHLVGGLSGLIGCVTLGRRILRLSAIDDSSIAVGSSATVFAGQLMVYLGLQSLSMPNAYLDKLKAPGQTEYNVFLNNLLAACSCSLCVVMFHFMLPREEFNHWTVMRCVQATVAGLVVISAGGDIYSPLAAIGLGVSGSVLFYLVSRQVFRSALEDYCNIVAIHLVCAVLGAILAPLFDIGNGNVEIILHNFAWQLICLLAISASTLAIMYAAFTLLECAGLLRNRTEYLNHLRANIAEGRGARRATFLERLFGVERDPVYLQPGATYGESSTGGRSNRLRQGDDR